jgi:hypothetical protein
MGSLGQKGGAAQHLGGRTSGGAQHLGLTAFGLGLIADVPPPGAWEARPLGGPNLQIRSSVTAQAIEDSWSGLQTIGWEGVIDGAPFVVERGAEGDHRFVHGTQPDQNGTPLHGSGTPSNAIRAVHHLSADATVLQCAPADPADPSWWRAVLDSVLFTVALLQGYEALHAGAVATPDGAIAITAATGGGKSTLLAELLQRGLALMADDVLVLESRENASPLAHPGAPLMTVPANIAPAPGALIASVGEERWVAVPAHPEAIPLKALVVLNRSPGLATGLHRAPNPLAALMGSLLSFPRVPERERARFELAGAITSHVPIWELGADPSVDPGTLAGLLRAGLMELQGAPT